MWSYRRREFEIDLKAEFARMKSFDEAVDGENVCLREKRGGLRVKTYTL